VSPDASAALSPSFTGWQAHERPFAFENEMHYAHGASRWLNGTPPIPAGYQHTVMARRELFTVACFDRLRVLTTELKRLAAAGAPVALRFGVGPALADARLAAALWWV